MLEDPVALALASTALAWGAFCFVAERSNPFVAPHAPLKRARWRFGRDVGLAVLLGTALVLILWRALALGPLVAAPAGAALAAGLAIRARSVHRRRSSVWGRER